MALAGGEISPPDTEMADASMQHAPKAPRSHIVTIDGLEAAAKQVIGHIETERKPVDDIVVRFIKSVQQFAGNAQGGEAKRVCEALERISKDTARLN